MNGQQIFEIAWMLLMIAGTALVVFLLARATAALQGLSRDIRFIARFVSRLGDPHHEPVSHHAFGMGPSSFVSWKWTDGKWQLSSTDSLLDDAGSPPVRPGLCEDEIVLQPR